MIDDELVLRVERLKDSLEALQGDLRRRYATKETRVGAAEFKDEAAQIAEQWLVSVANRPEVAGAIGDELLAELGVEFQRLLTYSEQYTTPRRQYDAAVRAILKDFRAHVIVPLKQKRGEPVEKLVVVPRPAVITTAFVGQSFAEEDTEVNEPVKKFISVFGLDVLTGEKPEANTISAKVRARIEASQVFIGIFTRRDKVARAREWVASPWVIDEKAYALAKNLRLILLKEDGVQSVGGIQGDYEYIEFRRKDMAALLIRLFELLKTLPR